MIRDPSDGSVREAPKAEVGIPTSKPLDSGLRAASQKDTYQARLEWSRGWLKDYQEKRNAGGEHDDSAATP